MTKSARITDIRRELFRLEWESKDWQNHRNLREAYASQAVKKKAELAELLKKRKVK
jgi:phage host-nuclease inhibitor protein Gam